MKDSVTADEDEALQTNLATTVTQFTIVLNQLIHRNQRFSQNHLRPLAGILDSSGGGITFVVYSGGLQIINYKVNRNK